MHIKAREHLRGERNPNAALSRADVLTIRHKYSQGVTQGALCRVYGVSISTVARIVNWQTWTWLENEDSRMPGEGFDEVPQVARTPEQEAQLERDALASAERLKALLAQDSPAETSGNRPFIYIPPGSKGEKG